MNRTLLAALGGFCLVTTALHAQVPNLLNYQGRVAVGATNFNGTGQFKFALVQGTGPTLLWKNDGSTGNTEPAAGVPLTVTRGLYSVLLGDTSPGVAMTAIPASVWANADVRLRVWFNDGTTGFQLLTPDQRLAPSGYLPDASVGSTAIAANAVTSAKIASGAVTNTQLAAGAVQAGNIASGAVGATQIASTGIATGNLANGAVTAAKLGTDVGLWSVSGSNVFRSGGNVGIGTSTPQAKLEVNGTSQMTALELRAPGLTPYLDFSGDAVSDFGARIIYSPESDILRIDGASRLDMAGSAYLQVPASGSPIGALTIEVDSFTTPANAQASYFLRAGYSGAFGAPSSEFIVRGSGVIGFGNLSLTPGSLNGTATANAFTWDLPGLGSIGIWDNLVVSGDVTCTAVNITSDRNAKEQFKPVDVRAVLAKVARLPITEWQYKATDGAPAETARHLGPMAQDFREAFALGRDEKHITSVDADGVALAAIQGLHEMAQEKEAEIAQLKAENRALTERLAAIERALGLPRETSSAGK